MICYSCCRTTWWTRWSSCRTWTRQTQRRLRRAGPAATATWAPPPPTPATIYWHCSSDIYTTRHYMFLKLPWEVKCGNVPPNRRNSLAEIKFCLSKEGVSKTIYIYFYKLLTYCTLFELYLNRYYLLNIYVPLFYILDM